MNSADRLFASSDSTPPFIVAERSLTVCRSRNSFPLHARYPPSPPPQVETHSPAVRMHSSSTAGTIVKPVPRANAQRAFDREHQVPLGIFNVIIIVAPNPTRLFYRSPPGRSASFLQTCIHPCHQSSASTEYTPCFCAASLCVTALARPVLPSTCTPWKPA